MKDELIEHAKECLLCGAKLPRVDYFFRLENEGWRAFAIAKGHQTYLFCPEESLTQFIIALSHIREP